ncbi:MAG: two-component regulator propeller domain-containing protein [Bacteroidales bacterium]|nr:two-component regulator propeller domain-containing protein [Bacteroidales bacterium]
MLFIFLAVSSIPIHAQTKLRFDIFTQEEGLPNNQIQCIFQDSKGWMWIGTSQGLSRFDGYSFLNFLPETGDSLSLRGNLIRVIREDRSGNLLIGTENGGLNVFNREKETFSHPFERTEEFRQKDISVNDIIADVDGRCWLATDHNVLIYDTTGNIETLEYENNDDAVFLEGNFVRNISFDRNGTLWIGTNNGLLTYVPGTNSLESFPLPFKENQNREIWEIYLDEEGLIWVGTYAAGLFIIDPSQRKILKNELNTDIERSETVRAISKGAFGEYWIGTRGGLFRYSKAAGFTGYYKNSFQEPNSLSNNSVWTILTDAKGETWIGTRGGLNLLAKSKQVFQNYSALPGNRNYLNSSIVYALWVDKKNNIWIGTEDGGINIFNPSTKKYTYITSDLQKPYALSQNCIKAFLEHDEKLFVATFLGGLNVIDLNSRKVTQLLNDIDRPGTVSDNRVWDLCMDKDRQIWVATSRGVDRFEPETNTFIHYPQFCGNEHVQWIETDSHGNRWMGSNNEIVIYSPELSTIKRYDERSRSMFEDSRKRIWIATDDKGLAHYTIDDGPLKYYSKEQGLANRQALCVLEDGDRNLWISTLNGLSKFDPSAEVFQNFTTRDGLGNNQFCYGAACKTQSGELLFGSLSGFDMIDPEESQPVDADVPLVFTDLKLFNQSVAIGNDKNDVLTKSISETEKLVLTSKQDVFTLEFAALNYVNSENNYYTYKLEGLFRDWISPSHDRVASFTNLNPGDYTLRVKRVLLENGSESRELTLDIVILPPFWKTGWFIAIIFALLLFMVYVLVRFFINREKIKSQLVLERVNARKLHEVDMMKLKFFTNISHEIRTPLTLILGPLEKMLKGQQVNAEVQENLKMMQRNAQNLDRLITQLLDFRKLQSGNLRLNLTEADIVSFTRNIVNSFSSLAHEKDIKLMFTSLKKRLFVAFDADKIEKILNNLLSNAFKYTESKGAISVNLSLIFDSDEESFSDADEEKQFIEISIKDTGKGIQDKNLDKIFVRFFQSGEGDKSSGVGIGLSLVKELVKLHKGQIFVTSKPGKGTKFTIRIPSDIVQEVSVTEENVDTIKKIEALLPASDEILNDDYVSPVMLIVEDNMDVRQFIRSHFNSFYKIIEANNGAEGLKLATEAVPDIIISDIIMPNMDGYELCKRLKNDERTSHIPILLLTAMHSKEHELKGLATGANDYITKPFDISVLQAKVENLLSIRDSMKDRFASTMVLEPTNIVITSPDERFLKKAIDVVDANMSDSEMDIEGFAQKVGVSRMQLYRKLHALTDMTVKEFIRHIRLKRATQLLVQQKLNISEIAYEVGFKDLSHFRKCFKREYGMSAKEYITKNTEPHTSDAS